MNYSVILTLSVAVNFIFVLLAYGYIKYLLKLLKRKESQYFTDYKYKNTVLRVFKPQFEEEAIVHIPINKILDRGTLSQGYLWVLIEL